MPAGQTLRWWEEEKQESRTVRTLPTPVVAEPPLQVREQPQETLLTTQPIHDIGEELEAEAVARALAAERLAAESIVFPINSREAIRRFDSRLAWSRWLILFAALCCLMTAILGHGPSRFYPLINIFSYSLSLWTQVVSRRALAAQKVALTVTPEGINPHLPGLELGVIPWRYIADIRVGKALDRKKDQDLLIELRDLEGYQQTLDKKTAKLLRQYQFNLRMLGPLGKKQPPVIRKVGYLLPLAPEAIVARIASYESVKRG